MCDDYAAIQFQSGKVSHDVESDFLGSVKLANFQTEVTAFLGSGEGSCLSRSRRSSLGAIVWNGVAFGLHIGFESRSFDW